MIYEINCALSEITPAKKNTANLLLTRLRDIRVRDLMFSPYADAGYYRLPSFLPFFQH